MQMSAVELHPWPGAYANGVICIFKSPSPTLLLSPGCVCKFHANRPGTALPAVPMSAAAGPRQEGQSLFEYANEVICIFRSPRPVLWWSPGLD